MGIPILSPGHELAADVLDAAEWGEYGSTTGPYDFQVPPVPHPWAFSAFQRCLHFGEGRAHIRLYTMLREPIPAGVTMKVLCWVYRLQGGRGGQLQAASEGSPAGSYYPPDAAWNPGWNLMHWIHHPSVSVDSIRVARVGVPEGHTWWSGLTVMRQQDTTPELEHMIQAQTDAGRLL